MTDNAPMTREERQAVLIEAAGGQEAYDTYCAALEALHAHARLIPRSIGRHVAEIHMETTQRLDDALRAEEERPRP